MLNYSKFACNDYNYATAMNQDLDEYLIENNIDLYSLDPDEFDAIADSISGFSDGTYTFNTVEAAICLANNYSYVYHLTEEQILDKSLYFDNPELCDCYVRYYVTLGIIYKRLEEHSR